MKIEIVTGADNNPVAEFFCASNTPETEKNVEDIGMGCQMVSADFARRLERERNGLLKKLKSSEKECVKQGKDIEMLELALKAVREERNEAREKAERYRLEANAMMLQRDELKEIVEQRILVGAEIHDKANSLLKQSNRTEAECEYLRKQLTAATSALRQIHLEVGDWIRSTIIVEE